MYGKILGATPPVVALGTAAVLPATGTDFLTSMAITLGAGLVTWGTLYVLKRQ